MEPKHPAIMKKEPKVPEKQPPVSTDKTDKNRPSLPIKDPKEAKEPK